MNYRDMLGFSKKQPKKKVEKRVVPKPTAPPVTELLKEEFGPINETVPLEKIDKPKFMKYFDLVLKTAGSNKAEIYVILKRMMPALGNRTLLHMAQGIEDAVKQMTGEK